MFRSWEIWRATPEDVIARREIGQAWAEVAEDKGGRVRAPGSGENIARSLPQANGAVLA